MGVLDFLTGDPCSQLNADIFPKIWLKSDVTQGTAYPLIASNGALKTFSSQAVSVGDGNMLRSLSSNSGYRLLNFLSNGTNTKLKNILLRTRNQSSGTITGLVDGYIIPVLGSSVSYTYSTTSTPLLPQNKIWDSADEERIAATTGGTTPSSILGKLLSDGVLLKKSELYDPNPTQGAQPTLIEIYKRIQAGESISANVQTRKTTLETKNLKFFAAFLAEYCFYRTRYTFMLKEFFNTFNSTTTPFTLNTVTSTAIMTTGSTPTQQSTLTAIAAILSALNTRMSDMLRILNALNTYYSNILTIVSNDINSSTAKFGSNKALQDSINSLKASEQGVSSNMSEADFKKESVRYMTEKNKYGNMLLGLYTFLNISALAILYKVYKS